MRKCDFNKVATQTAIWSHLLKKSLVQYKAVFVEEVKFASVASIYVYNAKTFVIWRCTIKKRLKRFCQSHRKASVSKLLFQ